MWQPERVDLPALTLPTVPDPPVLLENPPYTVQGDKRKTRVRRCETCGHFRATVHAEPLAGPHFCARDGVVTLVYWKP